MDSRVLSILFALTMLILVQMGKQPAEFAPAKNVATGLFDYKIKESLLPTPSPQMQNIPQESIIPLQPPSTPSQTPPLPELQSKSAALFELDSGKILFAWNIGRVLPIASVSKLMSAVIALEELTMQDTITIASDDLLLENHHPLLSAGDIFSLDEALYFILVLSDNSVTNAVAKKAAPAGDFVSKMNQKARELGMINTTFTTPTGLDGNVSNPVDLFLLSKYIAKEHPLIFEISRQPNISLVSRQGKTYRLKNTNALIGKLPGILGGKTGYTPESNGSLLLYYEVGKTKIISVVLGSSARFSDTEVLYNWYLNNYLAR